MTESLIGNFWFGGAKGGAKVEQGGARAVGVLHPSKCIEHLGGEVEQPPTHLALEQRWSNLLRSVTDPPDLQKMVRHFGSYSAIPAETWDKFDKAKRQWQERHRMPEGAIDGSL